MSDIDFYRWTDSNGRISQAYSALRNVKGGITWDKKYLKRCDRNRELPSYSIQKLMAVVDQNQDYTKEIIATLEWVTIEENL